jgi:hypothetical protein
MRPWESVPATPAGGQDNFAVGDPALNRGLDRIDRAQQCVLAILAKGHAYGRSGQVARIMLWSSVRITG